MKRYPKHLTQVIPFKDNATKHQGNVRKPLTLKKVMTNSPSCFSDSDLMSVSEEKWLPVFSYSVCNLLVATVLPGCFVDPNLDDTTIYVVLYKRN